MTEERLKELLRGALTTEPGDDRPGRDLWPEVTSRFEQAPGWSYIDLGLAAAAILALAIFPEWLWLLAYHL